MPPANPQIHNTASRNLAQLIQCRHVGSANTCGKLGNLPTNGKVASHKHLAEGASCPCHRGQGARPLGCRSVKKARTQECSAPQPRRTLCSLKAALLGPGGMGK